MRESVFLLCDMSFTMELKEFHLGVVRNLEGEATFHVGVVMFVCLILNINVTEAKKHVDDWWGVQEDKFKGKVPRWTLEEKKEPLSYEGDYN